MLQAFSSTWSNSMCSMPSSKTARIRSSMLFLIVAACIGHGSCRALAVAGSLQVQAFARRPAHHRQRAALLHSCGTVAPKPDHRLLLEQRDGQISSVTGHSANTTAAAAGPAAGLRSNSSQRVYVINTYVHNVLVADSTGAFFGAITPRQVSLQLAALNAAYNTSARQAGITWLYKLANITNTSVVLGADMCNEQTDVALKRRLNQGGATALNLYVTDMAQCGVLGAASWPWEIAGSSSSSDGNSNSSISSTRASESGSSASINGGSSSSSSSARGLALDGVTVHYDTLPLGELEGYNTGGTAIHEVGHWHGLLHVFENGCSPPGDGVDDTPYCLPPKDESCPDSRDSCPQQPDQDPISNWMSYSVDSCMSSFSPGQLLRAERMWRRYRLPAG